MKFASAITETNYKRGQIDDAIYDLTTIIDAHTDPL